MCQNMQSEEYYPKNKKRNGIYHIFIKDNATS